MHNEFVHQPPLNSLESLQAGRRAWTLETAESKLRGTFAQDRTTEPNVAITNVKDSGFSYDCGALSASQLIGLESLGLNVAEVVSRTEYDSSPAELVIADLTVEDEHLEISRYGEGITLRFNRDSKRPDDRERKPDHITRLVRARFADSPAYQSLATAKVSMMSHKNEFDALTAPAFDPSIDPLGTAAFLDDIGLTMSVFSLSRRLRQGATVTDVINESLDELSSNRVNIQRSDVGTNYTWGEGVVRNLYIDAGTGNYTYSAHSDPDFYYQEQPNQAPSLETKPFIDTEFAKELCGILDAAGLMLHPTIQLQIMTERESGRFGSMYTQLSREVAKWINTPNRTSLRNLFIPADAEYSGVSMLSDTSKRYRAEMVADEADETVVREAWLTADHKTESEAATTFITMIDDVLALTNRTNDIRSDLSVNKGHFQISQGACFDVTGYYVGATNTSYAGGGLNQVNVDNVWLLEKSRRNTDGAHTFLTQNPIVFNGVRLPKGALLRQVNEGWAFLRLTSFAFDNPLDQEVFAPEIAKAVQNHADHVSNIGGVTLKHLVASEDAPRHRSILRYFK